MIGHRRIVSNTSHDTEYVRDGIGIINICRPFLDTASNTITTFWINRFHNQVIGIKAHDSIFCEPARGAYAIGVNVRPWPAWDSLWSDFRCLTQKLRYLDFTHTWFDSPELLRGKTFLRSRRGEGPTACGDHTDAHDEV